MKVCFGVSPCVEGLFRGAVIYFRLVEDFVWTVWDAVWGQGVNLSDCGSAIELRLVRKEGTKMLT